jgi:NAD(P)-dependent dehydrogenase (short-subunit alcohol dehydrogenase family)
VVCIDIEKRAHRSVVENKLQDKVVPLTHDVGDFDETEAFIDDLARRRGTPDGLVLLTYASTGKALADLTLEDFYRVYHIGLTATIAISRKVDTLMADARKGSVILFSTLPITFRRLDELDDFLGCKRFALRRFLVTGT